jgi:hypothetical protein
MDLQINTRISEKHTVSITRAKGSIKLNMRMLIMREVAKYILTLNHEMKVTILMIKQQNLVNKMTSYGLSLRLC